MHAPRNPGLIEKVSPCRVSDLVKTGMLGASLRVWTAVLVLLHRVGALGAGVGSMPVVIKQTFPEAVTLHMLTPSVSPYLFLSLCGGNHILGEHQFSSLQQNCTLTRHKSFANDVLHLTSQTRIPLAARSTHSRTGTTRNRAAGLQHLGYLALI
eukprot:SAG31_NODE_994_length_10499_cov_6.293452_4_plen_154_part_00